MFDPGLYLVWIHVLAALLWGGGAAFLVLVVVQAGRTSLPLAERALYLRRLDRSFDLLVYGALLLLFFSGVLAFVSAGHLRGASRDYLGLLAVKVVLVVTMLVARLGRSWRLGPRLALVAAQALKEGSSSELERLWASSVMLLNWEAAAAVPVTLIGVLLAH